jgi:hypothetical protein
MDRNLAQRVPSGALILLARIRCLLDVADRSRWIGGEYRAAAFDRLNNVGHYRLVAGYWSKHRGEVEADVATWAETGRALASLKWNKETRKLLSSWREHRGVTMWMIANYVGCLSRLRQADLREIVASSRDALRSLPHDHCARYLAHAGAEACALLGDKRRLQETWELYTNYFDCKESDKEWFPGRRNLVTEIPMLVRFLEQDQLGLYRRTIWAMRWRHLLGPLGIQSTVSRSVPIPWWLIWILHLDARTSISKFSNELSFLRDHCFDSSRPGR